MRMKEIIENSLPAMPSRQRLNSLSKQYTGHSIENTHTKNWLYFIEPMKLRLVIAANLDFLHDMFEDTIGHKSGFLPFTDDMINYLESEDGVTYTHHIERYASPELNQLMKSNNETVTMIELGNNTIIMIDPESDPGVYYHGNPQKVLTFLKKQRHHIKNI